MALISKISKLNRIPQLLNKKREAEREEKRKREESSDRPPFPFNHRPSINRPQPSVRSRTEAIKEQTAKSLRQGIGRRVDLFV